MGSLADEMRDIRTDVFASIGEVLIAPNGSEVPGKFYNRPHELPITDGSFQGLQISFHCNLDDTVAVLQRGDLVRIVSRDELGNERDLGQYRFRHRHPDAGDESGLVVLDLGE